MGWMAAMAPLPLAAATLLRPHSSPLGFSASSPASSAAAVFRLLGRGRGNVVVREVSLTAWSNSSASTIPSSTAAAVGESGNRSAAVKGGGWCRNWGLHTRSSFRTFATMSSELAESAANNPGLQETPDEETKGFFLQQTMYRIKDPKISLDFYTRILGMSLLKRLDFPDNKFSLYFIGYEDAKSAPTNPAERVAWTFGKIGTLELTHNWGTESDENFKGHHNGNSEPRGYGHIGITVDDTYKACERFEKLGVKFVKKPDDGKMKGLAFIQDPDGYWIEIFDVKNMSTVTKS